MRIIVEYLLLYIIGFREDDCSYMLISYVYFVWNADVALQFARENGVPVYNFNLSDRLEPTSRLHAENVLGPADETLTSLLELCRKKLEVASLF